MSNRAVSEWYGYGAILSRNALWSIVSGPRSIGKTYGAKLRAVKRGIRAGQQTIWIRRTKTELTPAKAGFFDSIAPLYPGFEFRVEGDAGQVNMDGAKWVTLFRFIPLSLAEQYKGTEFPEVVEMVYDECFAGPGIRYLEDEVGRLRNLWITVNRSRVDRAGRAAVRVTLLGNAVALDNPYFLEWGFNAEREWQRGAGSGGDVVLHLVDAAKYARRVGETIYGKVLGTVALDYAEGDYFMPDGGYVVDERPSDSTPFATLETMRGTFGLWESADYTRMYVTSGALAAQVPVVAFEPMAVHPGVVLADGKHMIRKAARRHYRQGSMFLVGQSATLARQALAR